MRAGEARAERKRRDSGSGKRERAEGEGKGPGRGHLPPPPSWGPSSHTLITRRRGGTHCNEHRRGAQLRHAEYRVRPFVRVFGSTGHASVSTCASDSFWTLPTFFRNLIYEGVDALVETAVS